MRRSSSDGEKEEYIKALLEENESGKRIPSLNVSKYSKKKKKIEIKCYFLIRNKTT